MIYTGTSEVGGIYVGGTEIAEVYRGTDLVYQNFPKFTTFEANGSAGTKTGTLAMRKGLYRITMAAGGGSYGWETYTYVHPSCCSSGSTSSSVYGAGGGGGVYGVWQVATNSYVKYQVGAVDANSFIGPFTCTSGGVGTTRAAGGVSGLESFLQYATAGGNTGAYASYANASGGASALVYTDPAGGTRFPVINLSWGRGSSADYVGRRGDGTQNESYSEKRSNGDAIAGYLKVERIGD